MIKVKVAAIKSNPKNPRLIKDDKFKKLVKSIKEFPEMETVRPIVVNKDMVILGGNMRYKAMIECGYKEVNVEVVDWSEQKQNEFIIKDNVGYGEWSWDDIANEWDMEQIEDWGMDLPLFDKIDNIEDGEEIEFEQSVQLEPPKEYILIMAEPNSVEWEELKETLKLKIVRRGGYKEGSPVDSIALERVLYWNDFKNRLNVNSDTK
jgi:ParB-like chromosome segregation protein Spo0J